ncbi:MAG: gas vesicle protein GvpG [Chloroflexi bacterium]|nr:gas vesicle protein GvpG [Chloroflexota bacterium]
MLKLLFDIVLGVPLTLSKEILIKLRDEIDKERLITEESIKARLQQLQLLLQDGELSEEEYEALEDQLMERLKAVREYRRGVSDGTAGN